MAPPPVRPPLRNRFASAQAAPPPVDTPEDLIAKGRILAERNVTSFIPALRASVIVMEPRLPSIAAIDRWWRTYWNPKGVEWFVRAAAGVSKDHPCPRCKATKHNRFAYLAGVWVHEVGHCVFRHANRMEEQGFTNFPKWNIATDMEMNDDIPEMGKAAEEYWARKDGGDGGLCPAMCLPNEVAVNQEEYDLWNRLGSVGFFAMTGKDMWDVFHPVCEFQPGMVKKPFLMFPDAAPTPTPGVRTVMENGRIAEVYYEQIQDPPHDQLEIAATEFEEVNDQIAVLGSTAITVTLDESEDKQASADGKMVAPPC